MCTPLGRSRRGEWRRGPPLAPVAGWLRGCTAPAPWASWRWCWLSSFWRARPLVSLPAWKPGGLAKYALESLEFIFYQRQAPKSRRWTSPWRPGSEESGPARWWPSLLVTGWNTVPAKLLIRLFIDFWRPSLDRSSNRDIFSYFIVNFWQFCMTAYYKSVVKSLFFKECVKNYLTYLQLTSLFLFIKLEVNINTD